MSIRVKSSHRGPITLGRNSDNCCSAIILMVEQRDSAEQRIPFNGIKHNTAELTGPLKNSNITWLAHL